MPTYADDQRQIATSAAASGRQSLDSLVFSGRMAAPNISRSLQGGNRNGSFTRDQDMCRNIKTLANFEPPATDDEIHASALQFVRKLSGSTKPSHANEAAFNAAVLEVSAVARRLVDSLTTTAPPKNRDVEARKAKERAAKRFG